MDNVEIADAEQAILAALPCDAICLTRLADGRFKQKIARQALRNLIRGGQIQQDDDRYEATAGAEKRAEFRVAALAVLSPTLDHFHGYLNDRELRQELLYAVEGRLRFARKVCPKCRQKLRREAFGLNASRGDGLQHICRACRKERKP